MKQTAKPLNVKAGDTIIYDDGRAGHRDARAVVLSITDSGMVVQFSDRADTTSIAFYDKAWMQYITVQGGAR